MQKFFLIIFLLLIALFTITTLSSFSQTKEITGPLTYGPVPYRTPEQTIGEYYVVIPPPPFNKLEEDLFLEFVDKNGSPLYKDLSNKKLRLVRVEEDKGYFQDLNGINYKCFLDNKAIFMGVYPLKDIEMSRVIFLNKTLWIKNYKAQVYHGAEDKYVDTLINTFKPVTITDISPGRSDDMPLVFTFKTNEGKTACYGIDVSGTNTYHQPQYFLEENFYTKDPHLLYHFTPAVWKQIEGGETPIGMSTDAFELAKGRPTKKNFSQTGNTYHQQWVYGEDSLRYYYFTNGKYTGYN